MRKILYTLIISLTLLFSNTNDIFCLSTTDYISSTSPKKGEQYIISKPCISIDFSKNHNLDMSSINLFLNYKDITSECTVSSNGVEFTPKSKLKRGNQIVKIDIKEKDTDKKLSYEWYFNVGTPIYNHYRGLLHAHTNVSDGSGTNNDAFVMARDKSNLDFFAITEHSQYFDEELNCDIENGTLSKSWNKLLKDSDKFTKNDSFIALPGFEMTYNHRIDPKVGHINIFNSSGFISRNHENMDLNSFYNTLSNHTYLIGQFNHPGDRFGDFNKLEYSSKGDSVISLMEVRNGYSNDINKTISSYDMYQLALDNGWHLAPTSNQDNHKIDFGLANELRTVVLSTSLTKDSIYDSLKNMRVYATEDKNIRIDYSINNNILGSKINSSDKYNFLINVLDPDKNDIIKEIQVISNNSEIIKSKKFDSNIARLEFTLNSNQLKKINKDVDTFFYVKVIHKDNNQSVTAPIWIKK